MLLTIRSMRSCWHFTECNRNLLTEWNLSRISVCTRSILNERNRKKSAFSGMNQSLFSVGWWKTRQDREICIWFDSWLTRVVKSCIFSLIHWISLQCLRCSSNLKTPKFTWFFFDKRFLYSCELHPYFSVSFNRWFFKQSPKKASGKEVEIATWLILPVAYACLKD